MKRLLLLITLLSLIANIGHGATSYLNAGGSGDRTATITVTNDTTMFPPTYDEPMALVDGVKVTSQFLILGAVTDKYIRFDFGVGASKIIDEVTWYRSVFGAEIAGTWKFQGSDNASDWTDIGSSFTLGPDLTEVVSLAGNTTGYRYYQILGLSGSGFGNTIEYEVEFKIEDAVTTNLKKIAGVAYANVKKVAGVVIASVKKVSGVQ
jgi:hypothetical protein